MHRHSARRSEQAAGIKGGSAKGESGPRRCPAGSSLPRVGRADLVTQSKLAWLATRETNESKRQVLRQGRDFDQGGGRASQMELKNLPANAADVRNMGSVPGSGRSRGGGHSNPLQYSCLENPMDRGA